MIEILSLYEDIYSSQPLTELLATEGIQVSNRTSWTKELAGRYSLILLNITASTSYSMALLKQIRHYDRVPIFVLSSNYNETDCILSLELGADDYLARTLHHCELVARIRAILRRIHWCKEDSGTTQPSLQDSHTLYFNGVSLCLVSQRASYQEHDLGLTGTEFALLHILIKNVGNVVTREYLSYEVLGKNLAPYDRAIDMHISNLRKKLPPRLDGQAWFRSQRGLGYALIIEIT